MNTKHITRLLSLATCLTIIASCNHSSSTTSSQAVISPGSARAHMLCLSPEDIFYLNQESPKILQKIDRGEKLTIDDIIVMHGVGVSPDSMIQILQFTKTKFELNTNDVIRLQMEGVPYKVINYMIQS